MNPSTWLRVSDGTQPRAFEFGPYRLEVEERLLLRGAEVIHLTPKAFDTLALLVRRSGHLLSKDEFIRELWPDAHVEENNLAQYISLLRRTLENGVEGSAYIETVPRAGYRFVAAVREVNGATGSGANGNGIASAAAVVSQTVGGIPHPQEVRVRNDKLRVFVAGTLILLLLAAVTIYRFRSLSKAPAPATAPATAASLIRLTSDSGLTMSPALSPDGKLIAYASDREGAGNLDIWVQPVAGGAPVRLTKDESDDYAPAFSPDGQTLAYRSEREGGGIYAVPVTGGAPRKIAAYGRRPKFSPDGKWIAYWVGTESGDNTGVFMVPGAGKIFVAAASGGVARELCSEFAAAGYPIWTPDGKHLLFLGNRDRNFYHADTMDWWVAPVDGGPTVEAGLSGALKGLGFASASWAPEAWTPDGQGVLMSATHADTRNIWRVPISPNGWRISGVPQRLTFGTATDSQPSLAGNQVVFASQTGSLNIWSLPLDANRAEPTGGPVKLTDSAFAHGYPAVSPDGTKVAFSLQRSGHREIWLKDLRTAKETAMPMPRGPSFNPNFSPDGNVLLYRTVENKTAVAYEVSLSSGSAELICQGCSDYGWFSDQKRLVLVGTSPARISILDLATKQRMGLLDHPAYLLWNPRLSPDDRWVSFNATAQGRSRIFVAPVRDAGLVPEHEWIAIADSGWDDKPRWSPDGNTLYFVSQRDGFRCIWAQHLDAQKRPMGSAFAVFHAHESRRSMSSVGPGDLGISVARDKIVFNMDERTGNIWMTNLDAGRR